eukprot:GHVQ01019847.1.p1 GENE.GHVQ01019847.1~~GHVQ01019847.1.p1  ORF type:complete len:419 (+),score=84.04 GHVQ01019847.1:572-1828(+)
MTEAECSQRIDELQQRVSSKPRRPSKIWSMVFAKANMLPDNDRLVEVLMDVQNSEDKVILALLEGMSKLLDDEESEPRSRQMKKLLRDIKLTQGLGDLRDIYKLMAEVDRTGYEYVTAHIVASSGGTLQALPPPEAHSALCDTPEEDTTAGTHETTVLENMASVYNKATQQDATSIMTNIMEAMTFYLTFCQSHEDDRYINSQLTLISQLLDTEDSDARNKAADLFIQNMKEFVMLGKDEQQQPACADNPHYVKSCHKLVIDYMWKIAHGTEPQFPPDTHEQVTPASCSAQLTRMLPPPLPRKAIHNSLVLYTPLLNDGGGSGVSRDRSHEHSEHSMDKMEQLLFVAWLEYSLGEGGSTLATRAMVESELQISTAEMVEAELQISTAEMVEAERQISTADSGEKQQKQQQQRGMCGVQ